MNLQDKVFENWHTKAIAAVAITLLGVCFWGLPITQGLTYFSYDLPFALRANIRPDEALVVYMDDESRIRLHQPVQGPWDRKLHVRLLNELFERHAKAVVFDVLLDEAWPDKAVDEQFAAAIISHGHVVLAASCRYSGGNGEPIVGRLQHAVEPLGSAAPWGVAELPLDTDSTIRRHYYNEHYTNLAWQAATVVGALPTERAKPRWLNYYGPNGTIPHASYYEVLEAGQLSVETISNKVVFVGMAPIIDYQGSQSSDEFRTSFTRWTGGNSPGVEIQATACLNLLRGDWLSRLPFQVELSLILVAALALGFLLPMFRPGIALALCAGCTLSVAAIAIIAAQQLHWWFCWGVISLVEVPAAVAWFSLSVLNRRALQTDSIKNGNVESDESLEAGIPKIPDHEMLRPFGQGNYGQVWLAKNALGTYRAVKIISRKSFDNDSPFEREFRGMQSFEPISRSHEGFVDILQVGRRENSGYFFYIMELADDQNLGQEISPEHYVPRTLASELATRQKIPCEDCVKIGLVLAGALHKLHQSGLVHRDVKPSNIIFVRGIPKLADIGLVAETMEARSFVGTEGFLPPEGPGSPQADIYSLGKVLYEIAMGRDRCSFPELPTTLAEDPEREQLLALNEIVIKACRANPIRRYPTAEKMHAELKRLANRFRASRNKET